MHGFHLLAMGTWALLQVFLCTMGTVVGMLRGLNELMFVKFLEHCLVSIRY